MSMKRENSIWRYLLDALLLVVFIAALVACTCWLGGWFTVTDFSLGLIIAGVLTIILGVGSLFGGPLATHNLHDLYDQLVTVEAGHRPASGTMRAIIAENRFLPIATLAGLVAILFGLLLRNIVR